MITKKKNILICTVAGDNTNMFLNENWRDILKELGPSFAGALSDIFRNTLTAMADVVPYKNIFPKD